MTFRLSLWQPGWMLIQLRNFNVSSPAYTAGDFFLDEDWKRSPMRDHAKSFRFGGSWAGIETERPERATEPLIFPYDVWLGVSNFVVLATARFCNTLVI